MKKNKVVVLILVAISLLAGSSLIAQISEKRLTKKMENHYRYVISTPNKTNHQMRNLGHFLTENHFDIAGSNFKNKTIEVITTQAGIDFLNSKGIYGNILDTKIPGVMSLNRSIDERYLNPEKVASKAQAIANAFPQYASAFVIGKSNEGRDIWALLLSTTPKPGDIESYKKPSILVDGMHHAREIMTPEVVFDIAETILKGIQNKSPKAMEILSKWNVYLVPMLNVDGNNIVWNSDNWWRKNAKSSGKNIYGVDNNRNYSFFWNKCGGSSGSKNAQDYRGDAPASEPETKALIGLANNIIPSAYLSYHSYSELVIYPYGCDGMFSPENKLESTVGKELAQRLPSDSKSNTTYDVGTPWQLLYSVDGDSMTYMFGAFGALSFTFEVNQEFQPSYDLKEPTVQKHRKMWSYLFDRMNASMLTVKASNTGDSPAVISISSIDHPNGERPFTTNPAGYFFKVLYPGKYTVTAKSKDGKVASQDVDVSNGPASIELLLQ